MEEAGEPHSSAEYLIHNTSHKCSGRFWRAEYNLTSLNSFCQVQFLFSIQKVLLGNLHYTKQQFRNWGSTWGEYKQQLQHKGSWQSAGFQASHTLPVLSRTVFGPEFKNSSTEVCPKASLSVKALGSLRMIHTNYFLVTEGGRVCLWHSGCVHSQIMPALLESSII